MRRLFTFLPLLAIGLLSVNTAEAQIDTTRKKQPDGREYQLVKNGSKEVADGYLLNGLKEGAWATYWDNGYPHDMYYYHQGKKTGLHMSIDVTGYTSLMETFKDDILDGPRRTYNKGAMRAEEAYYVSGEKDGPFRKWYFDGKIQEESFYVKGNRNGKATWYYENGNKTAEYNYQNGNIEGEMSTYFENGKVNATGNYKNNVQVGHWKEFYDNEKLKAEGEYKNGEKEGLWKQYTDDGKPAKAIKYKAGEEQTK